MPGVELDAAEVDDPRERRLVVDHGEYRRVPAGKAHELLAYELRVLRHALLMEGVSLDAVGVAFVQCWTSHDASTCRSSRSTTTSSSSRPTRSPRRISA